MYKVIVNKNFKYKKIKNLNYAQIWIRWWKNNLKKKIMN